MCANSRVKHAEQHNAFIDGNSDSGKFERKRIVLWIVDNLQSTSAIFKAPVGHRRAIDANQTVAN